MTFEPGNKIIKRRMYETGTWGTHPEGTVCTVQSIQGDDMELEEHPEAGLFYQWKYWDLVEEQKESAVVNPGHYQNTLGVEVIDIIDAYFKDSYNLGNVLKYLLRADKKGNRQQDLEKALQYLKREVTGGW